ncbi:M24 family metallopeptidase [Halobacteriaceae archaeon SHR40]|uniref:M24 family metallopeptidase n=1 Tax=Halovenus amylolytica TaxID=2500550 RepID=UPI000FE2E991
MHPLASRIERLDSLLAAESLSAVWFARPNSFAWLTGGNNVVDRTADAGVAAAGYDGEQVTVITNNIEQNRLQEEELPESVTVESFDWYEGTLSEAVKATSQTPAAADFDVTGFEDISGSELRQPLLDADIDQYRALGETVAEAVESVCRSVTPETTEREAAARLRGKLAAHGIETPVALVGGSERAPEYRHLTPTETPLDRYAIVSVTTQRDGLFASCTRTVAFDPPEWLEERHRAATRVEASALVATRAVGKEGGQAASIFEQIQDAYESLSWSGEWRNHHQGGAAGFAGREWIATPDSEAPVHLPMAYAWNPTVEGAKSEDTVLVTESGYETLTEGDWPTETVEAVGFDEQFERPAILHR